jgi:redox-sensitive bicupin YhaK (pirin superfamily)
MTAGKGISHSERFENPELLAKLTWRCYKLGWRCLKKTKKQTSFINFSPEELPIFDDTGIWMRLIAGDTYGLINNVKTHSPLFYIHVELEANAKTTFADELYRKKLYYYWKY